MEQLFTFDPRVVASFVLTLFRVSLLVFLLPFYGGENTPMQVKAALCIVLTMALWPHLAFDGILFPAHPFAIALMFVGELLLGLLLGLVVHFIFAGIQTGGQVLGFQMGFTMINVADPMSGAQISITSHLLYMVSLLCFLALDGHLHLLKALSASFALIPPGGLLFTPLLVKDVIELSAQMFVLGVKIAAPVLASLFLIELALALMARAAPQMNLLMIGMPLKIAVGFFFMSMVFTLLAHEMEELILSLSPMFNHLLQLGAPQPPLLP